MENGWEFEGRKPLLAALWWPRCNSICEAVALPLKNTLGTQSTHVTWRGACGVRFLLMRVPCWDNGHRFFFAKKNGGSKKTIKIYQTPSIYIYQRVKKIPHDNFYNRRKNTSWNHQGVEIESIICCKKNRASPTKIKTREETHKVHLSSEAPQAPLNGSIYISDLRFLNKQKSLV